MNAACPGEMLAVLFLGERFHLCCAIGVTLSSAWIVLASLRPRLA
jgi:hypothetical protein